MAQKSMDTGDRAEFVASQEAEKAKIIRAGLKYAKHLQAEEKKLVAELKTLEGGSRFSKLEITFQMDGSPVKIGPTGDLSYDQFLEHIRAMPRSTMATLDNSKPKRAAAIKGRLRAMPGEYARRKADLETKIFHCDERIARYGQGVGK